MSRYEFKDPILRRAQAERFQGMAPNIREIRAAARKGYTEVGQEKAKLLLKTGKKTKIPGLVWYTTPLPLNKLGDLNVGEELGLFTGRNVKFFSSGALKGGVPLLEVTDKEHLTGWLDYGAKNPRFSKSARKTFKWASEHTTTSYNLGDVYGKRGFGVRYGKKFLEEELGQPFEKMVFRYAPASRSEGVWLGLDGLSKREKMAFTGQNARGEIPAKFLETELGKKLFAGKDPARLFNFRHDIIVSKKLDFAQEYRVIMAGGEAVDITYRWGSKGAQKAVKEYGLQGAIKKLGIKSGLPELIQPVSRAESKLLKTVTREYGKTVPTSVFALDIGLEADKGLTESALKVIEVQKGYGNITQPWVRQRIEHRLTGKWPKSWKIGAGIGIGLAALAGSLAINKIYNKIVGHHAGLVNKKTEEAIDSDFTAGESWTGFKDAIQMFAKYRNKSIVSGALAASIFLSPTAALAKDIGAQAARKMTFNVGAKAAQRISSARDIIDTALNLTHPGATAAAKKGAVLQLGETAWHESKRLTQTRQLIQLKKGGPLVAKGRGRGIFSVQPEIAQGHIRNVTETIADWKDGIVGGTLIYRKNDYRLKTALNAYKEATGLTAEELRKLTRPQIAKMLETNQLFGGVNAIYGYGIGQDYKVDLGIFTGDRAQRTTLWQTKYQRAKAASVKEKRISAYMASGEEFDRIKGHHSGWANKQTEAAIGSDFTAGQSYTGMWRRLLKFGDRAARRSLAFEKSASRYLKKAVSMGPVDYGKFIGATRWSLSNPLSTTPEAIRSLLTRGGSAFTIPTRSESIFKDIVLKNMQRLKGYKSLKPGSIHIDAGMVQMNFGFGANVQKTVLFHETIERQVGKYLKIDKIATHLSPKVMRQEGKLLGALGDKSTARMFFDVRKSEALSINLKSSRGREYVGEWLSGYKEGAKGRVAQKNLSKAVQNKMVNNPTVGLPQLLHEEKIGHTIINQAEKNKRLYRT